MRNALAFAFIVVFLDSVGFSLLAPVMPSLLTEMGDTDAAGAAGINKWLAVAYASMQFIFGPLLGLLSDRFGRKPIILISVAALGCNYAIMAMAPSLWMIFVGQTIAGIAGATYATAFAIAADVSTPEKKAANIGVISAGFGLGFILGPALGGFISEFVGPRGPMWFAACLCLLNFGFGLFFYRETAPLREAPRPLRVSKANPFANLAGLLRFDARSVLISGFFALASANAVLPLIFAFFAKAQFAWSDGMIGSSLAAFGLGFAITQGLILGLTLKTFDKLTILYLAIGLSALGFATIAAANETWVMFVALAILALGGMVTPTLNAVISDTATEAEQGAIQGQIASIMALASIISPFIHAPLFQFFLSDAAPFPWAGAPFAAAALLCLALVIPVRLGSRLSAAQPTPP